MDSVAHGDYERRTGKNTASLALHPKIDKARKDGWSVRFFHWDVPEGHIQIDLVEIGEAEFFEQLDVCPIFTESWCRLFANGANQVTLTINNV
jgi:hypothetical protein